MKKITDPTFVYTPSFNTDLKKKFKVRLAALRAEEARKQANAAEAKQKVKPLIKGKVAA